MADGESRRPSASSMSASGIGIETSLSQNERAKQGHGEGRYQSTSSEIEQNPNSWICVRCSIVSRYEDVPMLECDMCQTHTCVKCAKMTATAYKALARIDTMWFCTLGCTTAAKKAIGQGNNNTEPKAGLSIHDMDKLESSISNTVKKLNTLMYHELQDELNDRMLNMEHLITKQLQIIPKLVTENTQTIADTWAEIVGKNQDPQKNEITQNPTSLTKIMKEALDESKKEDKLMEERQCSIVIHRLKESNKGNADERKKEETDVAEKLCTEGARVYGCKIIKTLRLGRYEPDRVNPRPLKVTFENAEQREKLLTNLNNLKEADEDLRKLSISPDMSKETRNEIKKMVEEAKEKSRNSDGKIFRVRGPPGHLRIVETKKK